jgi:hypothetical protein
MTAVSGHASSDLTLTSTVAQQVTLQPGSDYIIAFNASNQTLIPRTTIQETQGLSESVIAAIEKAPVWIQHDLTRMLLTLDDPLPYADLIINTSTKYTDEIAFSLACSPGGKILTPELLLENAQTLYDNDKFLDYAQIIDYDDGMGNYYSTIEYNVLDNGTPQTVLLPPQIYYWYIVHPKLTRADLDATYGPLWRTYLFLHNDLGYPLLKEKLVGIQYLWDRQSYYEGNLRLWTPSMQAHPTAIEAVGYWVGKTVPNQAFGDRPGKPSIVAHEHNGWCGELQAIAVAAQRAALIPSIPACNVGEDHVWREFFDGGWHENDNWWSDGGGAVDEPDIYGYGWGKNMSSIFTWRGDDTLQDDTARYIHDEDRITVSFKVVDARLQPMDGARVLVLVKGPKDITYYKDLIWGKIQGVWDKLPSLLKGKLMTAFFNRLQGRFDKIPDSIQGGTITVWNYTNFSGQCSLQLGKNLQYMFVVQAGFHRNPYLSRHIALRSLDSHEDASFTIVFSDVSARPFKMVDQKLPVGDCQFGISVSSSASQSQENIWTKGIGSVDVPGRVDCFLVDAVNLAKYQAGRLFVGHDLFHAGEASMNVSCLLQDWFVVFRNPGRETSVILDFSVQVRTVSGADHVQIVSPSTSLFKEPRVEVGRRVEVSGVATGLVQLVIGSVHVNVTPVDGVWSYVWNTSDTQALEIVPIVASCGDASDEVSVFIQDCTPPALSVDHSSPWMMVSRGMVNVSGSCQDAGGISRVEARVDNESWVLASDLEDWSVPLNCSSLELGDHRLQVRAVDESNLVYVQSVMLVVIEDGHSWGPVINSVVQLPASPVNTSNIVIYANVSMGSPYDITGAILWYDNGSGFTPVLMFRYADFPVQPRHEEDLLQNESNLPVWGCELGQFPAGTTITYSVSAGDTGGNYVGTGLMSFTVGV